jgi:hypothetical protein
MRVKTVKQSSNVKTGKIPVTLTERDSCPASCPFKANGCYAENFPLSLHWNRVSDQGGTWDDLLAFVSSLPADQLWRHNVAGDLPHINGRIDARKVSDLVVANANRRGFTYTHHPVLAIQGAIETAIQEHNQSIVGSANMAGFTINVSTESEDAADDAMAVGLPTVIVTDPADQRKIWRTADGNPVVVCPATYRDHVTCQTCGLCARADRPCIVAFPAHGARRSAASSIVTKC